MMNAAVYHAFGGDIKVERVAIPRVPVEDGVLIQVKATGICRSDWHGWKGHDDDIQQHGLPFCPGHEFSGIVIQSTSPSFVPGDRVAVPFILSCGTCSSCVVDQKPTVCHHQYQPGFTQWGAFAEYVAIPRATRNIRHLPPTVTFVQAAALGCRFATAYRAVLQQGRLSSHQSIAIFGCGGLGLSCIIMAKTIPNNHVYPIIAVDVSQDALDQAKRLGATHTILAPSKEENDNNDNGTNGHETNHVRNQVWSMTHHEGVHVSVDAAGFASTCQDAVYCTRRGGRMVQVGLPIGDHQHPPMIPMGRVAGRELELVGSHGFDATADLPTLLEFVATKKLDPLVLVHQCVSLERGAQILMDMDQTSPLGMTMITDFSGSNTTTTTTTTTHSKL